MKRYNFLFFFLFLLFLVLPRQAQAQNAAQAVDTVLLVNGVCGMCERVIEKAALLPGVFEAQWDQESKILALRYDSAAVELPAISAAIAQSGYDTEYLTAPDSAYQDLHHCCHYRDPEIIEEHQAQKR